MKFLSYLFVAFAIIFSTRQAFAQETAKCEGPPHLCAEIRQLQVQLQVQKALKAEVEAKEEVEVIEAHAQGKAQGKAQDSQEKEDRMEKVIAAAALLAVILKLLVSSLNAWKGFLETDKQKAWLKVSLVGLGVLVFLATNVGYGIPWWQAIILAGGGPASIAVHEIMKLWPVLWGSKKLEEIEQEPDDSGDDQDK